MKKQFILFVMSAATICGGTILAMDNHYTPLSQKTFNKMVSTMTTKYRNQEISSDELNNMLYEMFKRDYKYQLRNPGMKDKSLADHYLELMGDKLQLLSIFEACLKGLLNKSSLYKDRIRTDLNEIEGRL